MAINPNIALSVQPIQQPQNMLGQYAQVMAIKAAQQEMEGNEGFRSALAGGMEATDPRILQYGKPGREAFKAAGEGRVKQIEIAKKQNEVLGSIFGGVMQDPATGPQAVSRLVEMGVMTSDQAQKVIAQAGDNPDVWRSLAKPYYEGAISAEKRLSAETSRYSTNVAAGTAAQRLNFDKSKDAREQQELDLIRGILTGGGATPPVSPPMGGGAPMGGGGPVVSPVAGGAVVPAQPNVLAAEVAPQAAPAPNVNALNPNAQPQAIQQISQLIRLGTPKALQAADALVKEYNILNPAGKIEQNAAGQLITINERTNLASPVLDANGKPVMGGKAFESAYTKEVGEAAGKGDVALVTNAQSAVSKLQDINQTLDQLKTSDAITGFGADVLKDVERFRAQFTKDAKAGKRAADTEILNAMLGSEVFGMIQSLGIGARGLDTPAEREYLREVMTGTVRMDKAALVRLTEIRKKVTERAIDEYNKKVDSGELNKYFETRGMTPRKIEKPAAPTEAVTDSVESLKKAGLWQYMSPEDQKLWQK
jgi:hypothetical protein